MQDPKLRKFFDKNTLSLDELRRVQDNLVHELDASTSSLKNLSSCVYNLPTGQERGTYYGIDFGGTNLRVLRWELPNGAFDFEKIRIPDAAKASTARAEVLFDFIATFVLHLMVKHGDIEGVQTKYGRGQILSYCNIKKVAKIKLDQTSYGVVFCPANEITIMNQNNQYSVGFTFSFPMQKLSINSARLITWTKGFQTAGVEGEDVCVLLQQSFDSLGVPATIAAVINDTTGTQLIGSLQHQNCRVGLILGTGTNACYYNGTEIINTEWGGFNRNLPVTVIDNVLNEQSSNVDQQRYEKCISGYYLGEICRLWFEACFPGRLGDFSTPYSFESYYINEARLDTTASLTKLEAFLIRHHVTLTLEERQLFRQICDTIVTRAANFTAVGISALVRKMQRPSNEMISIAIDGSVFGKPGFQSQTQATLRQLGYNNITLCTVEDGSGKGAVVAAAMAEQRTSQRRAKL